MSSCSAAIVLLSSVTLMHACVTRCYGMTIKLHLNVHETCSLADTPQHTRLSTRMLGTMPQEPQADGLDTAECGHRGQLTSVLCSLMLMDLATWPRVVFSSRALTKRALSSLYCTSRATCPQW